MMRLLTLFHRPPAQLFPTYFPQIWHSHVLDHPLKHGLQHLLICHFVRLATQTRVCQYRTNIFFSPSIFKFPHKTQRNRTNLARFLCIIGNWIFTVCVILGPTNILNNILLFQNYMRNWQFSFIQNHHGIFK